MLLAGSGIRLYARGVPAGLAIRVYDLAGVDPKLRTNAIRAAGAVLARAGIEADWRDCAGTKNTGGCEASPKPPTLLVRLTHSNGSPDRERGLLMGYAVIDPESGAGSLATVFVDRVAQVAHAAGGDAATLLGRAMAHELGHLFLGTNSHASSGLMRAEWTGQEILRNRAEDWAFSWRDRDQLGLTGVLVGDSAHR
jgi:hypothetical protein